MVETSVSAMLRRCHARSGSKAGSEETDIWHEFVQLGLTSLILEDRDGGFGGGALAAGRISRILGRELVAEPFVSQALLPAEIACSLPPTHPVRAALVTHLQAGARIAVASEDERRSPASAARATVHDNRLTARKIMVSAPADWFIVRADVGADTVLFLIGADVPGVRLNSGRLSQGGKAGTLELDNVDVEGTLAVAGANAEAALDQAIDFATLGFAAQLLGIAEGALALTLEYLRTRTQFGAKIGSFQALQHRAVDMQLACALSEASWLHAARLWDSQNVATDLSRAARAAATSAAKARSTDTVRLVIREAVQMHGAIGFTNEAEIGRYVRAGLGLSNMMGSAAYHRDRFLSLQEQLRD
jgi:alkylation response protein AidB-like acyl-CoA dehydrogenase